MDEPDAARSLHATVVVPTRNAARTLGRCLAAIRASGAAREIIVVDNQSTDATAGIARAAGARVVVAGPERSAQRNVGLALAREEVVAFLDADQIVEPSALAEACDEVVRGADAVVLPERSVGEGYWARVRALERSCYVGSEAIEACRVFRTSFVRELGGFDETLVAFEDWDLTARARAAGARIGRTAAWVSHDEGALTLSKALAKKAYYGAWEARYRRRHSAAAARQLSPSWRLLRLLRHVPRMARRPHVGIGVFALKALEFAVSRFPRESRG